MNSIQDICYQYLHGLDTDILHYIIDLIESYEDTDITELQTMISEFLTSTDYINTDDEALQYTKKLLNDCNLKNSFNTKHDHENTQVLSDEIKKKLIKIDTIHTQHHTVFNATSSTSSSLPSTSSSLPSKVSIPFIEKCHDKKENEKKHKSNKHIPPVDKVKGQVQEIDNELEAAQIAAAIARSREGAYNGALEASGFTLANPGGGPPLLENASCTLLRGRRYALIGRNGKGKTTLLRALAARQVGDIPVNVTVHYVSQEVKLTPTTREWTPVQCVLEAHVERRLLLSESQQLEEKSIKEGLTESERERQCEVMEQLELIDSDSAERRAEELLKNLGFSEEMRARPLKELSGGWRVRASLAAAIFAEPDLLLLDEPTNHLSILAVLWLARELSTSDVWKDRIVVVVSHDRYFIDEVCTDTLHISGVAKRLTQTRGNYSAWSSRRKEQQLAFSREAAGREAEIERLKEYAGHGFRYGGSSSQINKMQMKAKQAEKLESEAANQAEELAALQEDVELPLTLHAGGEVEGFLVQMLGVGFGYPGHAKLFSNADFSVTSKSRIVILGENGNGKTTLVKLMLGELLPTEGEIKRDPRGRFALVNQHHADQIPLDMTPLQFMLSKFPGDGSYDHTLKLRSQLASCGVTGGDPDLQNTPSLALSGGQRSRVALAAVSYTRPHVLVLDEPTNNLDLESVAALAQSVKNFEGAVVVVSHDHYFVSEVADEAWVVNGGTVTRISSFEAYRNKQLAKLNKKSK